MDVCPATLKTDVTLANFVGLNRTPALPLAVRGWSALIESGHCSNIVQVTADQNALVASVSGASAGVLTYHHDASKKEIVVGIGFVLPEYRCCGLYRLLWDALVKKARNLRAVQITSATFITNTAMRAVAAKQGRVETQVWLDFAVPLDKGLDEPGSEPGSALFRRMALAGSSHE